ncbi:MAG TPA: methionyl-tRNA formyltransferase [Solirubrobacteraceae bacterium]|nr:methionyl-tRNA formyltransferase [Solirubrobacteraceae bacterium]
MSTVFIGTSAFAAAVLERLAASERHRPALVITRPDRPSGRGRRLSAPPVAEKARALALALAQPDSVNDERARTLIDDALAGEGREPAGEGREPAGRGRAPAEERRGRPAGRDGTIVVCAFGALIKEPLLSAHELLNVHPSLLPRWRGAAPVERAIMAGDERTGVSIMRLTAGLDSGPVCLAAAEPIRAEDTYGTLAERLQALAGELLVRALEEHPPFVEQDEEGITYAEKITAADRLLDPGRPASELERTVRALHPHIGARVVLADRSTLGVHAARLAPDLDGQRSASAPAGLGAEGGRLLLACSPGTLELLVVQPPGGRAMDAGAYLRGHGLPAGS